MENFTAYNKFWVAIAGFILQAVTSFTGLDLGLLGLTPEAIIGFITSILVYVVPNVESTGANRLTGKY